MKLKNMVDVAFIFFLISISVSLMYFTFNYTETQFELNESINRLERIYTAKHIPIRTYRPCSNKSIQLTMKGLSMHPFLPAEGKFWAENITFQDIELGDIILYKDNNTKTLHAVCNLYYDKLYACGYNNKNKNELVMPEQVIMRYCDK